MQDKQAKIRKVRAEAISRVVGEAVLSVQQRDDLFPTTNEKLASIGAILVGSTMRFYLDTLALGDQKKALEYIRSILDKHEKGID